MMQFFGLIIKFKMVEEAMMDKAVKDALEENLIFQAELHIANAVNFMQLGYNAKEGFDFLHQAAAMRYLTAQSPEPRFFKWIDGQVRRLWRV